MRSQDNREISLLIVIQLIAEIGIIVVGLSYLSVSLNVRLRIMFLDLLLQAEPLELFVPDLAIKRFYDLVIFFMVTYVVYKLARSSLEHWRQTH